MNLGDIFDHVYATLSPDLVPVIEEGKAGVSRTLTAGEIKAHTNNLASNLFAMGCEPGDRVTIYMRNRMDYLLASIPVGKRSTQRKWSCL